MITYHHVTASSTPIRVEVGGPGLRQRGPGQGGVRIQNSDKYMYASSAKGPRAIPHHMVPSRDSAEGPGSRWGGPGSRWGGPGSGSWVGLGVLGVRRVLGWGWRVQVMLGCEALCPHKDDKHNTNNDSMRPSRLTAALGLKIGAFFSSV